MPFDRRNPVTPRGDVRLSELDAIADQAAPAIQYPATGSIYQSPTGQIFQADAGSTGTASLIKVTSLETVDFLYYPATIQVWDGSAWADGAECYFLPANDEIPETDHLYAGLPVSVDTETGFVVFSEDFSRKTEMIEVTSLTKTGGPTGNVYYPAIASTWDGEQWVDGGPVYFLEPNGEIPVVGERYHSMFVMWDEDNGYEVWTGNVPAAGESGTGTGNWDLVVNTATRTIEFNTYSGSNIFLPLFFSASRNSSFSCFSASQPSRITFPESGMYSIQLATTVTIGLRYVLISLPPDTVYTISIAPLTYHLGFFSSANVQLTNLTKTFVGNGVDGFFPFVSTYVGYFSAGSYITAKLYATTQYAGFGTKIISQYGTVSPTGAGYDTYVAVAKIG